VVLRPDAESMGAASIQHQSDRHSPNLSRDKDRRALRPHTAETGQVFTAEAVDSAFEQTRGQPWLVNALARRVTERDVQDRTEPITRGHIDAAREALILRRDTHIDSLVDKLHDPRVRRVIEPILAGAALSPDVLDDDLMYVRDLGLVTTEPNVRRQLVYQRSSAEPDVRAATNDRGGGGGTRALTGRSICGRSARPVVLRGYSESRWRASITPVGPQLNRWRSCSVVNGGGWITRELRWDRAGLSWVAARGALELKIRRGDRTLTQGVEQLSRYLSRLGLEEGTLVLFDRREGVSWEEKLYELEATGRYGQRITVFGA
jgi:hypothetical protein